MTATIRPRLVVEDVDAAIAYDERYLGPERGHRHALPGDWSCTPSADRRHGDLAHAGLRRRPGSTRRSSEALANTASEEKRNEGEQHLRAYLLDDVEDFHKAVLSNGLKPAGEPERQRSGNREFVLRDPEGYNLVFFQKK